MPYAVDLTLFINREDLPALRLPERYEAREVAERAGGAAVEWYAANGTPAEYQVREALTDEPWPATSSE